MQRVRHAALAIVPQVVLKQFVNLIGDRSLFQDCASHLSGPGFEPSSVATGEDCRFIVVEQFAAPEMAAADILIEPDARNTAPAICAVALPLGDWSAVWREGAGDAWGVVRTGPAHAIESDGTLPQAPSDAQQLVVIGLRDILAVAMPDPGLLAHKDRARDAKTAVEAQNI